MTNGPTRLRRVFLALVGAAALTGLAASCASGGETTAAPGVGPRSGGPVQVVLETALEEGALSDRQETAVLAIQDELRGEREGKRAMRSRMRAAASDIVRAGATDSAELDRATAEAMEAVDERIRVGSEALKELHALLDADQRELVADALRARIEERAQMRRDRANSKGGKLREVMARLSLDPTQRLAVQDTFEQMMGKHRALRPSPDEIADLVDAFETEDFAEALDAFCAGKRALMNEHLAAAGGRVNGALRILTPNQRLILAEIIAEK